MILVSRYATRAVGRRVRFITLVMLLTCVGGCGLSDARSAGDKGESLSKVAPELLSLYNEYSNYLASGKRGVFKSTNSLVQIIDDRVMVDAVASSDASVLKSDLESLGMQQAVVFGRIVSGQLPITAIRQLPKLPSLNFARAASAVLQGGPRSPGPGILNY